MTVYTVKTKEDFQKLLDFVKSQREETFSHLCWQRVRTYKAELADENLIAFLKDKIDFVICEDEEGNIRVVWGARKESNHPFGAAAFLLMEDNDYQTGDVTYLKEVFDSRIRSLYAKGVTEQEYWTSEKHLDYSKRICGDALEVLTEVDNNVYGKLWRVKVDFEKYVGVKS